MNIFCLKCGSAVKKIYWHDKVFYRCDSNPDHFFSEDMFVCCQEEIDMSLNFGKEVRDAEQSCKDKL